MSRPAPSRRRIWIARSLALAVDAVQIVLLPFFGTGFLSPANDVIDACTAAVMIALVGWHWAFLPSFVAEFIPGINLIPTWTAAVLFATRRRA